MTIDFELNKLRQDHRTWISDNPNGTLGDLADHIDKAFEQCIDATTYTDDAEIESYLRNGDGLPDPLYTELQQWDVSPGSTIGDRIANFEEFADTLEELLEEFGRDTKVALLPVTQL